MWFQIDVKMKTAVTCVAIAVASALLAASAFASDDSLKFIHNAGGGEIVYGSVSGQSTLPATMGYMLKQIHGHFGDRPQIGKVFRPKGDNSSVATSFTLTDKNSNQGAVAGLVIVSVKPGAKPVAAVLYDQAGRFQSTVRPMMKHLNDAWAADNPNAKSTATSSGEKGTAQRGPAHPQPLRQTTFPDQSGSVGLPDGWRIVFGQQGAVSAEGPQNESFLAGMYVPVMDPTNPQQRQMIQMETQGGRMPLPGSYVAIPYGSDPFQTLVSLSNQMQAKNRKPKFTFELIGVDKISGNCNYLKLHIDAHDGKGRLYSAISMCVQPPFMPGIYAITMNQVVLPEERLEQDRPTLDAMYASYKVNEAVVNAESRQAIDNIHAIGEQVRIRTEASNESWRIHQEGYQHQQDVQDRSSQAFSNYILDRTVIHDSEYNERGTVSNQYADSLVKADPNRFQYVPTQDYLKGIDY